MIALPQHLRPAVRSLRTSQVLPPSAVPSLALCSGATTALRNE